MPHLNSIEIVRSESETLVDVVALLEGKVFHVTKREYWPAIQTSGVLLPNSKNLLPTTFGSSYHSFFRKLGCVSLFDYRATPDENILNFRSRCNPLQPAIPGEEGIAILILNSAIHEHLIPWTESKENHTCTGPIMIVPYVETGHKGPIPLHFVESLIFFRKEIDHNCFAARMRKSCQARRDG